MKERDIQARQGQQTWIYNALCNVASLEHIFHSTLPYAVQVSKWEKWSLD